MHNRELYLSIFYTLLGNAFCSIGKHIKSSTCSKQLGCLDIDSNRAVGSIAISIIIKIVVYVSK